MRIALIFFVLVGCTHPQRAEPAASPPVSPPATNTASADQIATAVAEAARHDGEPLPALGATCSNELLCGTQQRIALQVENVRVPRSHPCSLQAIQVPSAVNMSNARSGCIEGGRLYLVESCVPCRTLSDKIVRANIAELTAAQREYLRSWAELPKGTVLATAADWSAALQKH